MAFSACLEHLKLIAMEKRQYQVDFIMTHKILHGDLDKNADTIAQQ